ncbi:GNAT family N-acetyltransferase [Angustibacter luteus]|uniref:GNAT family N-acetyltransferase n=1 Tax=Angustibacter luteus TaxID=658456 RepID=A0ABW1JG04_9ACTN
MTAVEHTGLGLGPRFLLELGRREGTSWEPVQGGIAILHEGFPFSHEHNRLLLTERVPWDVAVAEAERVLGAAGVAHRRIDWLAGGPGGVDAAWDLSHTVFMELVGDVVGGPGSAAVVPFESLRDAMREDWRGWVPDADDDELDQIVDRRRATAAACDLTWHAVLVDGEPLTWCDLRLLEVDGALVGQLDELLTLPEHRGHGYGRAALTHATLTAVAAGATSVFMEADRDDWPRELYSRMGFVVRGPETTVAVLEAS